MEEAVSLLLPTQRVAPEAVAAAVHQELGVATRALGACSEEDHQDLVRAVEMMAGTLVTHGKIVLFGNGGSAAIAQHVATEFVGRYALERGPLAAIALTADTALLTALANDFGYERVFERQVRALVRYGDVAIGMSTSGRSENVALGLAAARDMGARTIALVGAEPDEVGAEADLCLTFDAADTARIQELHLVALHVACSCLEQFIAGDQTLRDGQP